MNEEMVVSVILEHYPDLQAAYLFGSAIDEGGGPAGDVDIALLLPPESAKKAGNLFTSRCAYELGSLLKKDVDLLNARLVTTVFQKEIIAGGKVIDCGDAYALEEFEMLVLSYYQKLNEERKGILSRPFTNRSGHTRYEGHLDNLLEFADKIMSREALFLVRPPGRPITGKKHPSPL